MSTPIEAGAMHLPQNALLQLRDAAGTTIRNADGLLWVTQSGDRRDIILEKGQSFTLDRQGLSLVTALSASTVEIEPARLKDELAKAA